MAKLLAKKSNAVAELTTAAPWAPYAVQKAILADVATAAGCSDDGTEEWRLIAQEAVNIAVEDGMLTAQAGVAPAGSDPVVAIRVRRYGGKIAFVLNTGGFGGGASAGLADKLKARLAK